MGCWRRRARAGPATGSWRRHVRHRSTAAAAIAPPITQLGVQQLQVLGRGEAVEQRGSDRTRLCTSSGRSSASCASGSSWREVFTRGIQPGELRPDLDIDVAMDALYGALYYRLLISGQALTPGYGTILLEQLYLALAARAEHDSSAGPA